MLRVLSFFVIIQHSYINVAVSFTVKTASRFQRLMYIYIYIYIYIRFGRHTGCDFGFSVRSLNFLFFFINFLKLDRVKMTAMVQILHLNICQIVICFSRA